MAKIGFDALKSKVAGNYEKKGMSDKKADEVGAAIAAKVGREKYGEKGMERKAAAGRRRAKKSMLQK